jgi:hypothetical protein
MTSEQDQSNPPPATKRFVDLPAINKKVPLGAYIKAVRAAKENPDRTFNTGLTTWWPTKGSEIVEQFRQGMTDRINEAIPYSERGRR